MIVHCTEYKVALEGKVIQRAECRPVENAGYMALKRWVPSTACDIMVFCLSVCNTLTNDRSKFTHFTVPGSGTNCLLMQAYY